MGFYCYIRFLEYFRVFFKEFLRGFYNIWVFLSFLGKVYSIFGLVFLFLGDFNVWFYGNEREVENGKVFIFLVSCFFK